MSLKYDLSEDVIIEPEFKKFLKFRSLNNVYKFRVLFNYLLSNYFKEEYDEYHNLIHLHINDNFKNFLKRNKKYYGNNYSIEGVKALLQIFIKKYEYEIEI
jgi:hypothetical protein